MPAREAGSLNEVRARFGTALREWRVRQKLTQEELAERSGLSYKFIGEIERGRGNPTLTSIAKLSRALGGGPADFFPTDKSVAVPDYRVSGRDLQAVREALASIETLVGNI